MTRAGFMPTPTLSRVTTSKSLQHPFQSRQSKPLQIVLKMKPPPQANQKMETQKAQEILGSPTPTQNLDIDKDDYSSFSSLLNELHSISSKIWDNDRIFLLRKEITTVGEFCDALTPTPHSDDFKSPREELFPTNRRQFQPLNQPFGIVEEDEEE